ncbi:MAG: sugar nucleotide-binding protein, partial [Thiohalomonadales bacterium]
MNHQNNKTRVLVAGAYGQLGWELSRTVAANIELFEVDLDSLDISEQDAVSQKVVELKPEWIVNAAAYTAVDKAEQDSALA